MRVCWLLSFEPLVRCISTVSHDVRMFVLILLNYFSIEQNTVAYSCCWYLSSAVELSFTACSRWICSSMCKCLWCLDLWHLCPGVYFAWKRDRNTQRMNSWTFNLKKEGSGKGSTGGYMTRQQTMRTGHKDIDCYIILRSVVRRIPDVVKNRTCFGIMLRYTGIRQ